MLDTKHHFERPGTYRLPLSTGTHNEHSKKMEANNDDNNNIDDQYFDNVREEEEIHCKRTQR